MKLLNNKHLLLGAVLSAALFLTGCNKGREIGNTVELSGKVTLDGKPFSEASIRFTDIKSGASWPVNLNDDGIYKLEIQDADSGKKFGVSFTSRIENPNELGKDNHPKGISPPPAAQKVLGILPQRH